MVETFKNFDDAVKATEGKRDTLTVLQAAGFDNDQIGKILDAAINEMEAVRKAAALLREK